jgi:ATP-binding cassette, subfamily B (MDR/TAP), member 1
LDVAAKSRTTVCIAHRLSTIKNADNIIVVSRGEIVEQGTHAELTALGGVYKGLVEAQRISAERKEGVEKGIEEAEDAEEEIDQALEQVKSKDSGEVPLGLQRTKTRGSVSSIDVEKGLSNAGAMPQTEYSNIQLVKRVRLLLRSLT